MKQTKILVDTPLRKELEKIFGFKYSTILNILHFRAEGPSANAIRSYALQHGGKLVEIETIRTIKEITAPEKLVKILDRKGKVVGTYN